MLYEILGNTLGWNCAVDVCTGSHVCCHDGHVRLLTPLGHINCKHSVLLGCEECIHFQGSTLDPWVQRQYISSKHCKPSTKQLKTTILQVWNPRSHLCENIKTHNINFILGKTQKTTFVFGLIDVPGEVKYSENN